MPTNTVLLYTVQHYQKYWALKSFVVNVSMGFLLWSMKKMRPSVCTRCSQHSGSGPSSSSCLQLLVLRWLGGELGIPVRGSNQLVCLLIWSVEGIWPVVSTTCPVKLGSLVESTTHPLTVTSHRHNLIIKDCTGSGRKKSGFQGFSEAFYQVPDFKQSKSETVHIFVKYTN